MPSWIVRDEWNPSSWQPKDPDWASPTGVQTHEDLRDRVRITETAVVPFYSKAAGTVRLFEIKNLTILPFSC